MKIIRKLSGIFIFFIILSLVIVKLLANKKEQDKKLQALLDYSYTIPVEIVSTSYGIPEYQLTENGIVQPDKEIEILSETQGEINTLSGMIGDKVAAGQVLLQVERDVLESKLQLAKENLSKATRDLERFKRLAAGDVVTRQQLEDMQLNHQNALTNYTTLKNELAKTTIKSPVTGFISSRKVEKGSILTPGMPVMTIAALDKMNFVIKVAEDDIIRIKTGQKVKVIIDVLPGKDYEGVVKEISLNADMSGRYKVFIQLPNPGFNLRSGMNGRAVFTFPEQEQQIILPRKSIMGSIREASVFVVQSDTVVERKVQVKPVNDAEVAVSGGLQQGEKVVLTGHINLQSGTQVNIINQ